MRVETFAETITEDVNSPNRNAVAASKPESRIERRRTRRRDLTMDDSVTIYPAIIFILQDERKYCESLSWSGQGLL